MGARTAKRDLVFIARTRVDERGEVCVELSVQALERRRRLGEELVSVPVERMSVHDNHSRAASLELARAAMVSHLECREYDIGFNLPCGWHLLEAIPARSVAASRCTPVNRANRVMIDLAFMRMRSSYLPN